MAKNLEEFRGRRQEEGGKVSGLGIVVLFLLLTSPLKAGCCHRTVVNFTADTTGWGGCWKIHFGSGMALFI